jgi:hypothetical protein
MLLVLAVAASLIGCGGKDTECDSCNPARSNDCDDGQSCVRTTGGTRCVKDGADGCCVGCGA